MDLFSAAFLLILVTDPLGNIPLVISLTSKVRHPKRFILRETALAGAVLVFFLYFGPQLLKWLNLSEPSLRLAGGILLFLISIKMIFPQKGDDWLGGPEADEPIIFPLAVPLIAGPSAVATVMLFAAQRPESKGVILLAIGIAMLVSLVSLQAAPYLRRGMGDRGLAAIQRLMGMLLTAVSIEMVVVGLRSVFSG